MRFKFGKNWKKYSELITSQRIKDATSSLKEFFEVENFDGKNFIDVGCGSGIFSISACLLGAKVKSFDLDFDSVECTQDLSKKILEKNISIEKGDILDPVYVKKLGKFDYVYSWGVLHHTGDLNSALKNIDNLVKKNGNLFQSKFWFSYNLVNYLSSSFKVTYKNLAKMNGKDNEMNPKMSPAMDAGNNGFQKILLGFGLNFINNQKRLKGHRLAFEFIKPVFQKFNRIQMSEDYRLVLGWQNAV